ncbi:VIT domain-containing protein [Actinocrispum wychmicini]|uniref:Ca-activated chloride channel family protein n=1 Tax=Actinocrispum wychmicini TaxID=1213861 RepID=A0A4R2JMQ0_9PSEU|nr:VIT domain-containing protein [Actinocrispum wychmicini]TCO59902.1 Ca-activated chloride channel family protein [Actinocrispum wychmicini]
MTPPVHMIDSAVLPDEDAGVGCLRTERGNLPLESLDVRASITGLVSSVEVAQGFRNSYAEALEATYIFPLPSRAAVTAMTMEADGRVVKGVLKERGAARADYDTAVAEGRRASIAEEERPGVFTMRVGNIMPGERVVVRLSLVGELPYEDNAATFRFPLVVAPRYVPGVPLAGEQVGDGFAADTDAVPDASRISPPVLLPGFPHPVRLSVEVDIDPAGLPLTAVESSLHTVVSEQEGLRIRLQPGERADRDVILRLRYDADKTVATSLAVRPDDEGGTFALTVLPPAKTPTDTAKDVVLVLDRSGSMRGWKMVAARRAAARVVDTLSTKDRFAVLAFDNTIETPSGLVEAGDRNRFRAVEFLAGLQARGGTEMLAPLRRAAELLGESGDRDRVLVLVTDGQVGNEDQILRDLAGRLAGVRVHTIGVDRAVNEAFLQRLAASTGGRCELVESEDRLDEAMRQIHRRIAAPLVTGLRVEPAGLAADLGTLAPAPLPDVFAGAPVVITGRFAGTPDGALTVVGDGGFRQIVPASRSENPCLGAVWARARIRDLEDRYVVGTGNNHALEREIVDTSLRFGALSRFTAFVAADEHVVNEGGAVHRVTQPVEPVSGWDFLEMAPQAMAPARLARPAAAAPARARRAHTKRALSMPRPVTTIEEFVKEELLALRAASSQPVQTRETLLVRLASRIGNLVDQWTGEQATALRELAEHLARPAAGDEETERRWRLAVNTLESLAKPAARNEFWKR